MSLLVTCYETKTKLSLAYPFNDTLNNHFFTGVLKDYLRELPEPLFTKCLYQMMIDALAVCLPDDPQGNAKLMFSILDCLPKVNRVRVIAQ